MMKGKDQEFDGTLEVSGTGKVNVAPDEAVVHLRVITEAKTANDAVAANAKRTQSIIDAVSAQPNHGVTTTGLGVSPVIQYGAMNSGKIIGYRATNGVTVKTKIGYAAQIFDAGIQAGANESSGISFGVRDETPFREEALRLAVKVAFSEARIVAKTADVVLEGAESIWIDSGMSPILFRASALEQDSMQTPLIPEDLRITASVRIVFRTTRCGKP
jgi:uncharacterized protein YggE